MTALGALAWTLGVGAAVWLALRLLGNVLAWWGGIEDGWNE